MLRAVGPGVFKALVDIVWSLLAELSISIVVSTTVSYSMGGIDTAFVISHDTTS